MHDSNPERRNLVMTSLAFILYFMGGGYIKDDDLKIQLFNISFNESGTLVVFAWVMLFWFALRYWQEHKGRAISGFRSDIRERAFNKNKDIIIPYAEKHINLPHHKNNGFTISNISIKNYLIFYYFLIYYYEIDTYNENAARTELPYTKKNASDTNRVPTGEEILKLNRLDGHVIFIILTCIACFTEKSFSSYVVPYLLFLAAILAGIINYLYPDTSSCAIFFHTGFLIL